MKGSATARTIAIHTTSTGQLSTSSTTRPTELGERRYHEPSERGHEGRLGEYLERAEPRARAASRSSERHEEARRMKRELPAFVRGPLTNGP